MMNVPAQKFVFDLTEKHSRIPMISIELFAPSFSFNDFVKDSSVDVLYVISLKLFLNPLQKFSAIGRFPFNIQESI